MNNTISLIIALKAKLGVDSDYALAKILDVTRGSISHYQTGKRIFDDKTACKVASMLGMDTSIVLACIHIERAKSETEKRAWVDLLERLGGVAAALVLGIGLSTTPAPIQANSGIVSYNSAHSLYIMLNRKRKSKGFNPFESMVNQILSLA